jgi:hypothetical protein
LRNPDPSLPSAVRLLANIPWIQQPDLSPVQEMAVTLADINGVAM